MRVLHFPRAGMALGCAFLGLALSSQGVLGQSVTATAIQPSQASQPNSAGAALHMTGVVQGPGELPSPALTVMGPGSSSTTFAYTVQGSILGLPPGFLSLTGSVNGGPTLPFALALSVQLGGIFCGGFAGWPCMTGPVLFGNLPTTAGLYHLDNQPFLLLDGIGLGQGAPPASLGNNGSYPVQGQILVDISGNNGVEQSLAVQALVVDPTSPSGFTFSGALTVSQWVFYL